VISNVVAQAERDKVQTEEFMTKANAEKTSRDRSLLRLEEENVELRQHVEMLQTQLIQVEKDHSHRSHFITRTHCWLSVASPGFVARRGNGGN